MGFNILNFLNVLFNNEQGILFTVLRDIVIPWRNLAELSMICYMLRVQERRTRKKSDISRNVFMGVEKKQPLEEENRINMSNYEETEVMGGLGLKEKYS